VKIESAAESTVVGVVRTDTVVWIGLDDRASNGDYRWPDGAS